MKLKLLRPVPSIFKISSPFGKTRSLTIDGKPVEGMHKGVDFAVPLGTPITACYDGKVVRSGWENPHVPKQGFGMRIMQRILYEKEVFYLFYGHCSLLLVNPDQEIKKGQIIAKSGNTGSSTGPHLHIGARKDDTGIFYDMDFYEENTV